MNKTGIRLATVTLVCAASAPALAQEYTDNDIGVTTTTTTTSDTATRSSLRAPRKAFEVGVNAGYTQGFGAIQNGIPTTDVASGGFGVGADLGYRFNPHWAILGHAQYSQFGAGNVQRDTTSVRGAGFGMSGVYHVMPYERLDPWVSLGSGYRMLWVAPEGASDDVMYHGLEIAKLQVGLDVRATKDIAVGPVLAGGLDYFTWQNSDLDRNFHMIPDRRVSTFVFAGVQGRFDVGGHRDSRLHDKMVGKR